MSKGELVKKEILNHPDHYFGAQSKSLEARLDEVKISSEQEREVVAQHTKKIIRDKVLGLFKVGEVISELINWNESVDQDIKEAKKEYLLSQYFEKNEENEKSLTEIKDFLSNAQGNTLFNKILRILDDTPPDLELANHLSNALKFIIENNFASMFEQHKYALGQIEQLTPQALSILSDYQEWPTMSLGSYSATGSRVTSDWLVEFTQAYSNKKGVYDQNIISRVRHSINELITGRLIEAHLMHEKVAKCNVTQIGSLILPYINLNNTIRKDL